MNYNNEEILIHTTEKTNQFKQISNMYEICVVFKDFLSNKFLISLPIFYVYYMTFNKCHLLQ